MNLHTSVTRERIVETVQRQQTTLDDPGFCVACGEETFGVEPDAREYECENCGERAVYGVQELLFEVVL